MTKTPNIELKRARRRGRAIVEEAKIKALKIIADAYGEEIQKIAGEIAVEFKNEAVIELARFKKELEERILAVEEASQKVLEDEYEEVKRDIENYRASRFATIDKNFKETLTEMTKHVLGRSIDIRSHEDLIIEALEDAKRKNIF